MSEVTTVSIKYKRKKFVPLDSLESGKDRQQVGINVVQPQTTQAQSFEDKQGCTRSFSKSQKQRLKRRLRIEKAYAEQMLTYDQAAFSQTLRELYPHLFGEKVVPLPLHIHKKLEKGNLPGGHIRAFMETYCKSEPYLNALIQSEFRATMDPLEEPKVRVTDKHKAHAQALLNKLHHRAQVA